MAVADCACDRAWKARPGSAALVRAAILLGPVVAAVAVTSVVSHVVVEPTALAARLAWIAGLCVLSTATVIVVDRWGRRYLPIAALLRISLVFPDRAPSRFRSALRLGSVRRLEEQLALGRQGGRPGEPLAETAVRVIELATAMRSHDRRTRGHMERVRVYADMIGEEMGLTAAQREKLRWGALLHDIGKLEVPEGILNKPGRPTPAEWDVLRGHPAAGLLYLEPLLPWLGEWASAAWEHHEHFDGGGYPRGLRAEEITLAGRIVAAADAFEVMTATRSYKRPVSPAAARIEIARCAGTHFDPDVARALLSVSIGRLRWASGPLAWIGQLPFLGWTAPAAGSVPATVSVIGRTVVLAGAFSAVAPGVALATAPPPPAPAPATTHAPALSVRHTLLRGGGAGGSSGVKRSPARPVAEPGLTAPASTVPRPTAPRPTAPESTVPRSTVPESTAPGSTAPHRRSQRGSSSRGAAPGLTAPGLTAPGLTAPEPTRPSPTATVPTPRGAPSGRPGGAGATSPPGR